MSFFSIHDRVKHRAYRWKGIVTDVPFEPSPIGYVMVQWEHKDYETEEWIPAIMLDEDEMEYDWSELLEEDA